MQYTPKGLTDDNMYKLIAMLKVLAPDYATHMVVTREALSNTQPKYSEELNMHQVVFELLRRKMAVRGINTDIINPVKNEKTIVKDLNGYLAELYNQFIKMSPPELE